MYPSSSRAPARAGDRGFTLIELVTIMGLVAILAAVAVPRLASSLQVAERGYFDEMVVALRYAQNLATTSGCDVAVSVTTGGYGLTRRTAGCESGPFSTAVDHPSKVGGFSASPPTGVTITGSIALYFDRIGRPRTLAGTLLTAPAGASVGSRSLRVEAETGLVHEP